MSIELIKKLSEPLPKEAIQRTKGSETKKGYDTTGYAYQYCVDRFNEVCGLDWGFNWILLKEQEGTYRNGSPFFQLTVSLTLWIGQHDYGRTCVGSHISTSYGDALKGAITNSFKKTAAFWGVGGDAFRGTIDDDNIPMPDTYENITSIKEKPVAVPDRLVGDKQMNALTELKNKKGMTSEQVLKLCKQTFKVDHPRALKISQFNELTTLIDTMTFLGADVTKPD